ncbi:triacylglycerol lipase V precursor [Fusarium mexicanum]|uniref:Triacylglycerol lipase V n=1 Tax=Fusarium mexicanum TaxID=751941 RepID=A0A8H5I461_9HYPO|nr:triacylglycerol lipase V precursor [Fusarium mexicanum]
MKPLTLSRLLLPIYVGAESPTATLDSGPIFRLTTNLPAASIGNKCLGIPYAEKPQRFSRATKPESWTRPLNATVFGLYVNNSLSKVRSTYSNDCSTQSRESEDCLFINAFALADPHPSRAVLMFISGGGWEQGNGEISLNGFAAYEDIAVISFNCRTNDSPDASVSDINLGIYGQQLALE